MYGATKTVTLKEASLDVQFLQSLVGASQHWRQAVMVRSSSVSIVLVLAITAASSANDGRELPTARSSATASPKSAAAAPLSIYNDKVRCFRFHLEHMLVTFETAETFMVRYKGHDNPEIIGAFADSETNCLVIVGPPEAEHAIRMSLASWVVAAQGLSPPPLKMQKRVLEHRWRELLRIMADLEVAMVAAESAKAEQLKARIGLFVDELKVVARQIEVVDKYLKQLQEADAQYDKSLTSS